MPMNGMDATGPAAVRVGTPPRDGPADRVGDVAARSTFSGRRVSAATRGGTPLRSQVPAVRPERGPGLLTRAIRALTSPFHAASPLRARDAAAETPRENPAPAGAASGAAGARETLATGHAARLGNYLVNCSADGTIPPALRDELQSVVAIAGEVDGDILRAVELLDRSATTPLSDDERRELSSLVGSNRHNLAVLQTWLAERSAGLADDEALTPQAKALYDMLQTRFADRLMDLADLVCLHDLEERPDEPVSRSARASANLLHADAALDVAEALDVPGLDGAVKEGIVRDLQAHRDGLARVRDAADGRIERPTAELRLAGKELWEAPLPLVKPGRGRAEGLAELKARWSGGGAAPLPLAHPQVGQARMLREFIAHRLGEAGVAPRDMPDLGAAQEDAYNGVVNAQPWEPIEKRVRTRLPDVAGPVVVDSRIEPARAMAARFAEDYPGNGVNCADRTQYAHVPNLARTTLANADGEELFAGLRHGVIDAYGIDAKHLARLPADRLRTMVGDLLVRGGDDAGRQARIDALAAAIRSDPAEAARAAGAMREQASRDMAVELATAALASEPASFERACAGETVDLHLSSISLLTPDLLRNALGKAGSDERTMQRLQAAALRDLAGRSPVELAVRDADGRPRTVRANVALRQFNFGVNAGAVQGFRIGPASIPAHAPGVRHLMGWGFAMARNDPELARLVGPAGASALGGDVVARLRSMAEEAEGLRQARGRLLPRGGASSPAQRAEAARLSARIDGLEKRAGTLADAATQLKAVWAGRGYRRGGGDPYKMVSRLALVGHLMGETPLFNCKSGKDRTGQLDAEVKFLATVADQGDGRLPAVDEDMARWRAARTDFTLNTGNLEMQQLNTGLPGYKLAGVAGLANMVDADMKPVYRGGSAYVQS